MSENVSLRDMIADLRRIEDSVVYFQNAAMRQTIAIEEYMRLALVASENEPAPETNGHAEEIDRRCGPRRPAITEEAVTIAIEEAGGDYSKAAGLLGVAPTTLYKMRPRYITRGIVPEDGGMYHHESVLSMVLQTAESVGDVVLDLKIIRDLAIEKFPDHTAKIKRGIYEGVRRLLSKQQFKRVPGGFKLAKYVQPATSTAA